MNHDKTDPVSIPLKEHRTGRVSTRRLLADSTNTTKHEHNYLQPREGVLFINIHEHVVYESIKLGCHIIANKHT